MKTYTNDPFNLKLSIRGLAYQMMFSYSDLYEYAYYFTFKREMKEYLFDFPDPYTLFIEDPEFFETSGDPLVRNCSRAHRRLADCRYELMLNWGIDEFKDMRSKIVHQEANRFHPYKLNFKRAKSYKRLKLYYERTLQENIAYLYLFASAITASKYRVPDVFRKQFELPIPECLNLLNQEDHNVFLLVKLICGLNEDLIELRTADRMSMLKRTSQTYANRE